MEEPGRLQSMGSLRVGHDRATSLSLFTFMHWRRKWQPTPVFLPGESQGRGSLVGCRLWGRTESDMTDVILQHQGQTYWEFPGSPMVPTLHFYCRGPGLEPWNPGEGTKICMAWPKINNKNFVHLKKTFYYGIF